jgi:hypothetical protein
MKVNKIKIESEQEILDLRIKFIAEKEDEIYNQAVTICHDHHLRLHSIYGKRPKLVTAKKQQKWVEIQRQKYGMV